MISVSRSAIESLMRTGMLASPSPGNNITIAPTRANASMKAAARAGRSETSRRMAECPGSNIRMRLRQALLRMLEPKGHSQKLMVVRFADLTFAMKVRGNTEGECQIHRTTHFASAADDSRRYPHHVTVQRIRHEWQ